MAKRRASGGLIPGLGAAIRARRLSLGLSMPALAEKAGTHWTTVSKIENGHRSVSAVRLVGLAEALGVTMDDLVKAAGEAARAAEAERGRAERERAEDVAAAVAAERERCAALAGSHPEVAARIREGGAA